METHEPAVPVNWPEGHVSSEFIEELDVDECICVTIHGVKHYLHATTARQLARSVTSTLNGWNHYAVGELRKHGLKHKPV